ncbi:MAG: hypothetical protein ACYDCO_27235 [Armatimonadota bacterium]
MMGLSETVKLRRAVLRCGSPWNVERVDRLIARCDLGRRYLVRLDEDGRHLLRLAESFLDSPAGTALAERRWWLMRHAALALEARERRRELEMDGETADYADDAD